ncbi:MAG: hypothetical protein FWF35_04435 [Elusimicrobia bacterium]|nr:hypothetical protein [Elusimicrobiota bacterium]
MVTVVLPYIFGSMALAAVGIVCVYKFAFAPGAYRGAAQMWAAVILGVIYLPLSFFYGIFLACLSTLRSVAGVMEGAVSDFILRLKKYSEHKVNSMQEGLPKQHAQLLLNAGIKEVTAQYNAYRPKGIARALSAFLLAFIVYASRKILFKEVKQAGAEITLGMMFAGPQSLAAAAVLNLKLTATALLVLGWILGLIILSGLLVFIIL